MTRELRMASSGFTMARGLALAGAMMMMLQLTPPPAAAQSTPAPAQPATETAAASADAPTASGIAAVQNLAGRWSGQGWVESSGGVREQVKCVTTYFLRNENAIEQNLRCASASFKVDAQINLKVAGSLVTGTWEEKGFSANGTVAGQVKTGGFNLQIKGDAFSANMSVASGKGSQTLNITPKGTLITKISIGLNKG